MIYLATSLFTVAEREFGFSLTERIEELGYKVYYPWRDTGDKELMERFSDDMSQVNDEIVRRNLEAIRQCEKLIAVAEGSDVESGTSMEVGFAHALGKKIRCLRTDFRTQGERIGSVNIMISRPAENFYSSVDELVDDLRREYTESPLIVENIPDFYDAVAHEYSDSDLHPTTALFKRTEEGYIKEILRGKQFKTAMDIGCGDGNFLLNVEAERKIGLDSSVEMIKRHRSKLPTAQYILGNCSSLLVGNSTIDVLHSSFLLDHLSNAERSLFFNEANRVMSEKGIFLLAAYSPEALLKSRDGKTSFEYVTSTGKRFNVPSDFRSIIHLREQLGDNFVVDNYSQVATSQVDLTMDCYVLRRK